MSFFGHEDHKGVSETQDIGSIPEQSGTLLLLPLIARFTLEETCKWTPAWKTDWYQFPWAQETIQVEKLLKLACFIAC